MAPDNSRILFGLLPVEIWRLVLEFVSLVVSNPAIVVTQSSLIHIMLDIKVSLGFASNTSLTKSDVSRVSLSGVAHTIQRYSYPPP
jgi:hypothetical protein